MADGDGERWESGADAGTILDAPAPRPLGPVSGAERIAAIDVLRGVAVLGILPMNIFTGFALVSATYFDPTVQGGFDGPNRLVWLGSHLIFELKMLSIFAMLFGAGVVILSERAEVRGTSPAGYFFRRMGWLAVIGLAHAYLLWFGDVLFSYALCGMLIYVARRLAPWVLVGIAAVLLPIPAAFTWLIALGLEHGLRDGTDWAFTMHAAYSPPPEAVEAEVQSRTGSFADLLRWNAGVAFSVHLFMLPMWGVWRIGAMMLLGMALMKWGVFTARRSSRFYVVLAATGYGLGIPIVWLGAARMEAMGFDTVYVLRSGEHANYFGSVAVALGHVGLVMLICRAGVLRVASTALAAVGRMALSNYLAQTVICLGLFWGLGLFGELSRVQLAGVTVAIWLVLIAGSVLWFRSGMLFGPAEWAWRSLTYGRVQPMRSR